MNSDWPDVELKISPIFKKVAQQVTTAVFTSKDVFQNGPKSNQILRKL